MKKKVKTGYQPKFRLVNEFEIGTPRRPIQVWCIEFFEEKPPYTVRVNLDNDDWLMERKFNNLKDVGDFYEMVKLCDNQAEVYEFLKSINFEDF